MHSSISKTAAVLAIGLPLVHAFDRIRFPSTVTAGKPTTLTIVNDLDSPDSFDIGFDSFRVYLATTPPGWGTGPVCQLVNSSAIDTTSLQVTIPPDVGPSGSFYSISVMEFNQDPSKDGPSGFEYSGTFDLEGGTGDWSKAELAGNNFGNGDIIPCTSYNCVRQCTTKVDYDKVQSGDDAVAEAEAKKAYECMMKCPGIDLPSWDEISGDDSDGEFSGSGSSSSDGEDGEDVDGPKTVTVGGSTVVVTASASASASASGPHKTLQTVKSTAPAAASSSPSQVPSASISGAPAPSTTSNSTVPIQTPNAGNQVAAGVPMLFTMVAGFFLFM